MSVTKQQYNAALKTIAQAMVEEAEQIYTESGTPRSSMSRREWNDSIQETVHSFAEDLPEQLETLVDKFLARRYRA